MKVIPLTSEPNRTLTCTVAFDGQNKRLLLRFRYNSRAGYWFMSVSDPVSGGVLLDGIPLVTGAYPAGDLFGQYGYKGLGSCAIISAVKAPASDIPDGTNLGTEFVLVWTDTVEVDL